VNAVMKEGSLSCLAELLASQEGFCSMELVNYLFISHVRDLFEL
jgi:hypothetical protein